MVVAEQLAARHEVHVFAQNIAHNDPRIHYHRVSGAIRRPRWINQIGFAVRTWWKTRTDFDIVYSHENIGHGNVQAVHVLPVSYSLLTGRSFLGRVAQHLRIATSPRLFSYLWLERKRFANSDGRQVIVASETLKDAMAEAYPHVARRQHVVTPGVSVPINVPTLADKAQARVRLKLPTTGTCMLFVGNDFRKKGLPALLVALEHLPEEVALAVVGNTRQGASLEKLVQSSKVAHRVFLLGAQQDMDLVYTSADMLVHPTLQDSYAMVVLEALSYGLPVVVSGPRYCGISATLTHGENALLLNDPTDGPSMADAIRNVLIDEVLVRTLAAQGRAFAQQHSWDITARAHEDLFQNVVKR